MKKIVVYVHGRDGTINEAEHYKDLFKEYEVVGFDYKANTPMTAKEEFSQYFKFLKQKYDHIILIANSIGAYFSLMSIDCELIEKAYFISPIVDMQYIIERIMNALKINDEILEKRKVIKTSPDDEITWEYLSYVRSHPIIWTCKTNILYGGRDFIMPRQIVENFIKQINSSFTVMENGEHWFHTKEQMEFLDKWIQEN